MVVRAVSRKQDMTIGILPAFAVVLLYASTGVAADDNGKPSTQEAPVFDAAFLNNPVNIAAGNAVWQQCRHCHGISAYPGKAPKLVPGRMDADFIFDRVTNG